ncbi:MAG: DegT/DnrJ/EryC1/StrS family aminotransferase [Oscillospiraceae bacterium]
MIPFYIPYRSPRQQDYLNDAQERGMLQGDGHYSQLVCHKLEELTGLSQILLTPSASHALELALWDLKPGDEVILPAYNFPAAANAVLRAGGKPVLCDVDPGTQNLCPYEVEALITSRTRVVCLTHYAGISCDMKAFWGLQQVYGFRLVEDAAQGVGAYYEKLPLGAVGDRACYSFHATKNIQCGEGGAYLQRGTPEDFKKVQMYRDKGTNRHEFLAGERTYYTWECVGSSHLLSDLNAALLLAQLEDLDRVTQKRLELCAVYQEGLASCFARERLYPMEIPRYARGNGHIYYIRCRTPQQLRVIRDALARRNIACATHFVPLHLGSMGRQLGYRKGDFPVSERTGETLLRLPLYHTMVPSQVNLICETIQQVIR